MHVESNGGVSSLPFNDIFSRRRKDLPYTAISGR
jgi:hypothetical protein